MLVHVKALIWPQTTSTQHVKALIWPQTTSTQSDDGGQWTLISTP